MHNNTHSTQLFRTALGYIQTPAGKTTALFVLLCAVGVGAFLLGRVSVGDGTKTHSAVAWCSVAPVVGRVVAESIGMEADNANEAKHTVAEEAGGYVGSRSGSVYHLPWCSGAQRIAEENKRWFTTKEEAEAAGYRPAKNCPGL